MWGKRRGRCGSIAGSKLARLKSPLHASLKPAGIWGHGVGMCQVGAYGMARRGHDVASILAHYYTGVRLESVVYR